MKKILLVLSGIVLMSQVSFGKKVDENKAKAAGASYCKSKGNSGSLDLVFTANAKVNAVEIPAFYVFNTSGNGFVIVSADDNVRPILGYSSESVFTAGNLPANVAYWLGNYKDEIGYVIEHNVTPSVNVIEEWKHLKEGTVSSAAAKTTSVSQLIHAIWNQSPVYNALCPNDGVDTAIVGCVATAMAQVMWYWKWPKTGHGSSEYNAYGYGLQSANFGATTYRWDSMQFFTAHYNHAIALVNYHAGISVNMGYGVTSSGAYVTQAHSPETNCAEYALKNYFRYVPTLHGLDRSSYTDAEWLSLVEGDIDNKMPVICSGYGSAGGHCFIADGYMADGLVHFNWGWGGYANGYFTLDNLAPGSETFNDGQSAIFGIKPDYASTAVENGIAASATDVNVYPNPAADAIHISCNGISASEISMVDMMGRVVTSALVPAGTSTFTIATSSVCEGLYLLQIKSTEETITREVIISRQ